MRSPYGHPQAALLATTLAALKLLDPKNYEANGLPIRLANGMKYVPHATSTLTADDIFVVQATGVTTGRWLLATGEMSLVPLTVAFGTADLAVLATLPTNSQVIVGAGYWSVDVAFTGGTSSAIGLSSSNTNYNTAGDVLGGSGGDVLAALTAGSVKMATVGTKVARGVHLVGGNTIIFNRITSAFTAGSGRAVLPITVIANPGA